MADMLKITPRAKRVAIEKGLNIDSLNIKGTGFDGGICEKDILDHLERSAVTDTFVSSGTEAVFAMRKATPVAQKMAEAKGIALEEVLGTGIHGKITKQDLLGLDQKPAAAEAETKGDITSDGKEIMERVPYSGVRKIIGDRLSQSKFTAPHLYFTQKVNLEKLLTLRKEINEAQDKKTSVTDYIAKAVIITLQKYPEMNASLVGETIEKYKSVNLGIAVAAPGGLIVPVVKNAQRKTILEISKESSALFDKARTGKLAPGEYTGGTFTISNLGMFGIENFTAIINPPEVGILAISATKDEPYVETDDQGEKKLTIKPMMNITLTVDHRIIDGLLAAQFVTEIKRLLEKPIELML